MTERQQIRQIFETIIDLIEARKTDQINEILGKVDVRAESLSISLAYLSITCRLGRLLPNRLHLYEAIKDLIMETEPDHVGVLLQGLHPHE